MNLQAVNENSLKQALSRGHAQMGAWINMVHNPGILPLMKSAGLDFARLDMEHTGVSFDTVATLALVARSIDFPLAVRPPVANREWITRLLDIGIWNLHCPQVESAAHAREIVLASRFAPLGLRGQGYPGPATDFAISGSVAERRTFANAQVFVTVMFETAGAFADLEEIAAMKGIDALTIGPADLAQDLGVFGQPSQNAVLSEKLELILAAAKRHGKIGAVLCATPGEAAQWRDKGAQLLACSSDTTILQQGFSRIADEFGRVQSS